MRESGVLMHLTSLPSPCGVGAMGAAAREFADFLAAAGQSCWQILPICPTGYGDSPYQSFSTFAGNPYLIDLDELAAAGLLRPEEYQSIDWESAPDRVNFDALNRKRYQVLAYAVRRFLASPPADYDAFCRENDFWLPDYALFMALKDSHDGKPFWEWEAPLRQRQPQALAEALQRCAERAAFWAALQYLFRSQWNALKSYVNGKGITIIGDLPIYVSLDSADVWSHPELFQLGADGRPTEVSGCPPDGFSATGQLWGNPLFDWDRMAQDGYAWWIRRIDCLSRVYDVLRIDHFRGFDAYYAIPYGAADARTGHWCRGPGMELFRAVEQALGPRRIIAEDLGFLTDSVRQLLRESGYPGMKVLELAFDSRDPVSGDYLPHNFRPHCVAYTGTHDNDTVCGWMTTAAPEDVDFARRYFHLTEAEGYHWGMMRGLWSSTADLTIVQAQDLLGLGSEARMNVPSTPGGNWQWRALPGAFDRALAEKLRGCMELYDRLPARQA